MTSLLLFLRGIPLSLYMLAIALAAWAYTGYQLMDARSDLKDYELATANQKIEANRILGKAEGLVASANAALAETKTIVDKQDVENAKTIKSASDKLAAATRPNGNRLRDPNATGCRPGGANTNDQVTTNPPGGAGQPTETGGLLSEPLTRLLAGETRSADIDNRAYEACRVTLLKTHEEVNKLNAQIEQSNAKQLQR